MNTDFKPIEISIRNDNDEMAWADVYGSVGVIYANKQARTLHKVHRLLVYLNLLMLGFILGRFL